MLSDLKHLRTLEYAGQPPVNVVDWTVMGAATPVKNREQYDSCWACATTSSPEGDEFIVTDNMSPLRSCNSCENQLCVAGDRFVAGLRQTQMLRSRRSTLTWDGVKTRRKTMATSRKRCTCTCRGVHCAGSSCTLRRASTGCGIFDASATWHVSG